MYCKIKFWRKIKIATKKTTFKDLAGDGLGLLIAGIVVGMLILYLIAIAYEARVKKGFSKRLIELRKQAESVKKQSEDMSLSDLVAESNKRRSKSGDKHNK